MTHATAAPGSRPSPSPAPSFQFVLAALAIAALFGLFFVVPEPLWSGQPTGPLAQDSADQNTSGDLLGLILLMVFVAAVCLPFRPYVLAQRAAETAHLSPSAVRVLLGATALVAFVASLMYPGSGSDIFDYAGFERMWVIYGDNPLLALPINHPADWTTPLVWFPDRTPAYGPLWALLTWPIVRLAADSALGLVLGYKILSIAAYAGCCWLIWSSLPPSRRAHALVVFAWSPLVLFDVLGKVHNDVLPAVSLLALFWLLSRRAPLLSLPAVAAGGLIKVTAVAAAPALLVYLWRHQRVASLGLGAVLGCLLAIAVYASFWEGPRTFASVLNQTGRVVWSPATLLIVASSTLPGGPFVVPIRMALAMLWCALTVVLVLRRPLQSPADLAATIGWGLLGGVLLLTSAVYAHYFVPGIALAAVSTDQRLRQAVLWLSVGGLVAYNVDLLGIVFGRDWLASDAYRVTGSLMLLVPALLAMAACWNRKLNVHATVAARVNRPFA